MDMYLNPKQVEAHQDKRAWVRNQGRLENRSHVVPKMGFQDGGTELLIFTHKIIILAWFLTWYANFLSLVCFPNNAIHL